MGWPDPHIATALQLRHACSSSWSIRRRFLIGKIPTRWSKTCIWYPSRLPSPSICWNQKRKGRDGQHPSTSSALVSVRIHFPPSTATNLTNKTANLQISIFYMDTGHNSISHQPYIANVHARAYSEWVPTSLPPCSRSSPSCGPHEASRDKPTVDMYSIK